VQQGVARVLGPLAGGAAYQTLGLGGAYVIAAALYLAAGLTVSGLDFRQEPRRLRFGRIAIDIVEAVAVARGDRLKRARAGRRSCPPWGCRPAARAGSAAGRPPAT
jgi:hypothetical protein